MLQRCTDEAAVAQAAARLVADRLAHREPGTPFHLALTGGGLGIRLLDELGPMLAGEDLAGVHLWWGDERFVPAGDEDRNDGQASGFLEGLPPEVDVHRALASDQVADVLDAAAAYGRELRGAVAGDWPALDLVLLGMGPDGHVASLFPGQRWESERHAALEVRDSPKPPPQRVTLTMPVLTAAGEVVLVVGGEAKADALGKALHGDRGLPAGELLTARSAAGRATAVLADSAALTG